MILTYSDICSRQLICFIIILYSKVLNFIGVHLEIINSGKHTAFITLIKTYLDSESLQTFVEIPYNTHTHQTTFTHSQSEFDLKYFELSPIIVRFRKWFSIITLVQRKYFEIINIYWSRYLVCVYLLRCVCKLKHTMFVRSSALAGMPLSEAG